MSRRVTKTYAGGKFTPNTQAALQAAQEIARQRSHHELDGEHLLLALIHQRDSCVPTLLQKLGVVLPELCIFLPSVHLPKLMAAKKGAFSEAN